MNRRTRPRRVVHHTVRIGTVREAPLPCADVIDASPSGVLVAFAEPIGLMAGQRLCLSFALPDGALHLMASVVRVERGDDFRTYVGVELDAPTSDGVDPFLGSDPDLDRWLHWLDGDPAGFTSAAPADATGSRATSRSAAAPAA